MKKTVLLTSATILLGVGFQAINASAAETFSERIQYGRHNYF